MISSKHQEQQDGVGREQAQNQEQQSTDGVTEPVYTQYIIDRVKGHSYVSRRNRRSKIQASPDEKDLPDEEADLDKENTDCANRPPHWLCYVPPFVAKFPYWLEQNPVCVWAGNVQFRRCDYNHVQRRRIFLTGFVFNFLSLYMVMISCFAFSKNYPILSRVGFTRSKHTLFVKSSKTNFTEPLVVDEFRVDMGLRAIAVSGPANWTIGEQAIRFGPFCDFNTSSLRHPFDTFYNRAKENVCGKCKQSSNRFFFSLLMNMLAIIKNMFSDINRMYPKYDLNCPNFMGSLMGVISVALGFNTIYLYQSRCFREVKNNPSFIVPFIALPPRLEFGIGLDELEDLVIVSKWERGPGMICLQIATWLRLADTLCNFFVPTPSITRSRKEQEEYELQYGENPHGSSINGSDEDEHAQLLLKEEEGAQPHETEIVHDTDSEQIVIVKKGRVIVETNDVAMDSSGDATTSAVEPQNDQPRSILTFLSFGAVS